jgi:pimeloyl-ACP methyl ester carboxylesterase
VRLGHAAFVRQSMLDRGDDRDRLVQIACPVLVLAGDRDRLRSVAEAREMAEAMAHATFRVIEQSGHMIPLEQPAAMAGALLAWLARCAV